MTFNHLPKTLLLSGILAIGLAPTVEAAQINIPPENVTGSGSYNNSTDLLVDGVIPDEGTAWNADTNVYWNGTEPNFTFDLGGSYTVTDIQTQVDNNDDYLIESSQDGTNWNDLYTIDRNDGNVASSPGGMDTFTWDDINFNPVDARYLRMSATGGDNSYAISEFQVKGDQAPVPEPAALTLLASGVIAIRTFRKKRA